MTMQTPNLAPGGKPAIQSVTVIAGAVMALSSAAGLVGYSVSSDMQSTIINLVQQGYTVVAMAYGLITGIVVIWGRIRATKQITTVAVTKI